MDTDNRQALPRGGSVGEAEPDRKVRAILDVLPAHMAVLDSHGIITAVNQPWVRFAAENGLQDTRHVCEGADYLAVCRKAAYMNDPMAREAMEGIEAVLQRRRLFFTLEYPCHSPTQQRWFEMEVRPCDDIGATVITHLDITERKRSEETTRSSEQRLRGVFENAGVGILEVDSEDRFIAVNDRACQIIGYASHDILHMSVDDLTTPEDRPRNLELRAQMRSGQLGRHESERKYARPDGTELWLQTVVSPIRDLGGRYVGAIAAIEDITALKRAEEDLRRSQDTLKYVLDTIPQAVFWKDRHSVYLGCNKVFANAANLNSPDDIVGKTDFDLPWPKAEAEAYRDDDAYVITNNTSKLHILEPLHQADGSRLWIDTSKLPLVDEHGSVYGVLGVYEDVTDRMRIEAQLQQEHVFSEAILTGMPGMLVLFDEAGHLVRWNKQLEEITGYRVDEMTKMHVLDWFGGREPDTSLMRQVMDTAFAKGHAAAEASMVTKDGRLLPCLFTGVALMVAGTSYVLGIGIDISELKQAEKALRQSEERFRALYEKAPLGIARIDSQTGRFLQINAKYCDIVGRTPAEMLESEVRAVTHPDDLEQDLENMKRLREGRSRFFEMDKRYLRPDGSIVWVNLTVVPEWAEGEPPSCHIAMVTDITARKLAEEALRRSEVRYRTLFDAAQDGILVMQGEFCTECNPRAAQMFGCHSDRIVGQTPFVLSPRFQPDGRESAEIAKEIIREAYAGSIMAFEWRHRRCDGTEFDAEVRLSRMSFGEQPLLLGLVRDVTERKKITEALRTSEAWLKGIFLAAPVGIGVVVDRRFVEVNQRICDMTGFSHEELVGQSTRMVYPSQDEFERVGREKYGQAVDKGAGAMEVRWRRKDGLIIDVLLSSTPINPDDIGAGVTFAVVDITERKRIAEDLRRSNQDLEQFAYVVSHDLQEPLRMVTGFTNLLQDRYKDKLDEDADQYIHYMVEGASRMSHLITDLLAYSRVNTGGRHPSVIACEGVLDKAIANLGTAISESGARVTHDSMPTLLVDELQIAQLFQNLIGNAIKFRREGVAPKIHIGARREGDQWVLWVTDNGIGIPPEQFGRVFTIFQRLHGREKYPGTGIGLAICKKIVERHGGRIWVESKVGEGTTFYFSLPASGGQIRI